jgi:hypothetical protein
MIKLNDIDKTVIDESKVVAYYGYGEDKICIVLSTNLYADYYSPEQRDKDIELLDKLFDVKSIEDKANAYPHEIDVFNYAMSGIKKESKLVSEGEDDLVKKEEYLTWDEVCNKKGEYFSAEISNVLVTCLYNGEDIVIFTDSSIGSFVYDKDLFNALRLKKVSGNNNG